MCRVKGLRVVLLGEPAVSLVEDLVLEVRPVALEVDGETQLRSEVRVHLQLFKLNESETPWQ